jgi:hypothetical protein
MQHYGVGASYPAGLQGVQGSTGSAGGSALQYPGGMGAGSTGGPAAGMALPWQHLAAQAAAGLAAGRGAPPGGAGMPGMPQGHPFTQTPHLRTSHTPSPPRQHPPAPPGMSALHLSHPHLMGSHQHYGGGAHDSGRPGSAAMSGDGGGSDSTGSMRAPAHGRKKAVSRRAMLE